MEEAAYAASIMNNALAMPAEDMDERRRNFARGWAQLLPPVPSGPVPDEVAMIRPDGTSLRALLYRPQPQPKRAVLYLHGGGFTTLSPEDYEAQSRTLAQMLHAVMLVPDFRLAPEHPFPAAWEDAVLAYKWLLEECVNQSLTSADIFVMGDSAGGCLAAGVVQQAAREGLPQPAGQVLIYPMLDMASTAPSRYDRGDWVTDFGLRMTAMVYAGAALLDPRVSPLREEQLEGLAPAYILSTDCDPLMDEAKAYALRLETAGVPVTSICYSGQTHGFVSFGGISSQSATAMRNIADWIEAVARGTTR